MITASELKELVIYSSETGEFVSRVDRSSRARAGRKIGTILPNGYVHIMINGRFYKGHRLAWLYMTGEWPAEQIDHVNGERSDNRWSNLRHCSASQNSFNRKKYRNNSTSVTGVYWHKRSQRWTASIDVSRKRISLGYFDSIDDAGRSRREAERKYFGDFVRAA
jgi:hypothetical protein